MKPGVTVTVVVRLHNAGLSQKEIADMAGFERSLVSHWQNGNRSLTMEAADRIGRALVRRWPERRMEWAAALLGELAANLGCSLIPNDDPQARVVVLNARHQRLLEEMRGFLAQVEGA
jgi:transcriptional regulator with XRE-family HTH domain